MFIQELLFLVQEAHEPISYTEIKRVRKENQSCLWQWLRTDLFYFVVFFLGKVIVLFFVPVRLI